MPCLDCGIPTARSRCDRCEEVRLTSTPDRRPTAHKRGYDYAWKVMRLHIIQRDGAVCVACQKFLTDGDITIDHIVPLASGGARLDPINLQVMCRKCNSSKSNH